MIQNLSEEERQLICQEYVICKTERKFINYSMSGKAQEMRAIL